MLRAVGFFIAFSLFSLRSCNLLHPRLTTFCASLRSFKMCSLRNHFNPVIAHHNEKFHVLRAVGFFIAFSLFSLQSYILLHPRLTTFCASLCSFKMCSLRNQFDPVIAHQKKASRDPLRGAFFLPFPSHLIYHLTSCIRAHDHLRVALLLQMMFAAEPVRSYHRPP